MAILNLLKKIVVSQAALLDVMEVVDGREKNRIVQTKTRGNPMLIRF